MTQWQVARLPQILFGAGVSSQLLEHLLHFGKRVLLVTGAHSFDKQAKAAELLQSWREAGCVVFHERVSGEPSPRWVDDCVLRHAASQIEVVVAIGGGSALDAAKAVAGLLPIKHSVMDYLEGVGPQLAYAGAALPFIAMPTTAGTGSEATKNAVLSQSGEGGFKKSFRHDSLMPVWAVIDPTWMLSLPAQQIAFNGLDAITQLIEGYTSLNANPFTDGLALAGLEKAFLALPRWFVNPNDLSAASDMAYAALLSGMVLAHAGLGAVHGLAAPLGAFFPAPHGAVCGILLAECTATNIAQLQVTAQNSPALSRYVRIGRLLMDDPTLSDASALLLLVEQLRQWHQQFALPSLSAFGMCDADIPLVVANARGNSMKTNPIELNDAQLATILAACL
ncbi:MAG: iron-containing alcohol dehydrogenase [Thiotrichales bacterium]|jgi:alcohol dehydrogenase|nr:iron-containing alcohol dehydrogenase [Thiotrichales bacterium]